MTKDTSVFSKSFTVRSYEVDEREEATLPNICNYFQEAAGLHAHQLNFDISHLFEKGLTWILYELHVKINRYPRRWENVVVSTRPSSGDGIRAYRDYELFDSDSGRIAVGLSHWMVLNIKKMRPVKMPEEILAMGSAASPHVIEIEHKSLKALENNSPQFITRVGKQDLDMNNHVNNAKYIEWVTGYLGHNIIGEKKCLELKIQYVAAAAFEDDIFLASEVSENETSTVIRHTLFGGKRQKVLANARTVWGSLY